MAATIAHLSAPPSADSDLGSDSVSRNFLPSSNLLNSPSASSISTMSPPMIRLKIRHPRERSHNADTASSAFTDAEHSSLIKTSPNYNQDRASLDINAHGTIYRRDAYPTPPELSSNSGRTSSEDGLRTSLKEAIVRAKRETVNSLLEQLCTDDNLVAESVKRQLLVPSAKGEDTQTASLPNDTTSGLKRGRVEEEGEGSSEGFSEGDLNDNESHRYPFRAKRRQHENLSLTRLFRVAFPLGWHRRGIRSRHGASGSSSAPLVKRRLDNERQSSLDVPAHNPDVSVHGPDVSAHSILNHGAATAFESPTSPSAGICDENVLLEIKLTNLVTLVTSMPLHTLPLTEQALSSVSPYSSRSHIVDLESDSNCSSSSSDSTRSEPLMNSYTADRAGGVHDVEELPTVRLARAHRGEKMKAVLAQYPRRPVDLKKSQAMKDLWARRKSEARNGSSPPVYQKLSQSMKDSWARRKAEAQNGSSLPGLLGTSQNPRRHVDLKKSQVMKESWARRKSEARNGSSPIGLPAALQNRRRYVSLTGKEDSLMRAVAKYKNDNPESFATTRDLAPELFAPFDDIQAKLEKRQRAALQQSERMKALWARRRAEGQTGILESKRTSLPN
ncbi:hypothetical protein MMC20_004188 [Loxospora ochrophaea]|nr:hypothetical protein [Loxospora ochrophaea]